MRLLVKGFMMKKNALSVLSDLLATGTYVAVRRILFCILLTLPVALIVVMNYRMIADEPEVSYCP